MTDFFLFFYQFLFFCIYFSVRVEIGRVPRSLFKRRKIKEGKKTSASRNTANFIIIGDEFKERERKMW